MSHVCSFEDIKSIGDWSNGMTEVSKTFSGSSILSSPVLNASEIGIKFPVYFCVFNKKDEG